MLIIVQMGNGKDKNNYESAKKEDPKSNLRDLWTPFGILVLPVYNYTT